MSVTDQTVRIVDGTLCASCQRKVGDKRVHAGFAVLCGPECRGRYHGTMATDTRARVSESTRGRRIALTRMIEASLLVAADSMRIDQTNAHAALAAAYDAALELRAELEADHG